MHPTPHAFWNPADQPARLLISVMPRRLRAAHDAAASPDAKITHPLTEEGAQPGSSIATAPAE
jgi:hypothetical protein